MDTVDNIATQVHHAYWIKDSNCANTTLECLATIFETQVNPQLYKAAVGLHGAGGYRAQCGLVEGMLLFLGLYSDLCGKTTEDAIDLCYAFAENFEKEFGSLQCFDLRPGGFLESDPPHACEALTVRAINFGTEFIKTHFV